jgi:hypothetical protein
MALSACNPSDTTTDTAAGPAPLAYGKRVSFAQGGNAEGYKGAGWSTTEEKFTWSEGTSAQLRIPVAATEDKISLKIRIAALVKPPELPSQPVEVLVNDQKVAEWQVGNTAEFVAEIPPSLTKPGGSLNIIFKTPKAASPKTLGLSDDPRILGICCFDLELAKG